MTAIIAKTKRLYLRCFLQEDSIHFYEMNNDEDVLRYTGDCPFTSLNDAERFVAQYDDYRKYGMGRWAVIRKEDTAFLGWCGLKYHPDESIVEVGYRFYKKFWGQGYATEAVKAVIEYGFFTLKLPRIYAHVKTANEASVNVLKKCGMRFLKPIIYNELSVDLYMKESRYITIKKITAKETYPVRHAVLRQGKPIASCALEGDDLSSTLHFGAFFKESLIGVITFLKTSHSLFEESHQLQLRGMGVLPGFQKKGIGEFLVKTAEERISEYGPRFIWMNARVIAVSFYKKLGYKTIGDAFTIGDIGLHYVMIKYII